MRFAWKNGSWNPNLGVVPPLFLVEFVVKMLQKEEFLRALRFNYKKVEGTIQIWSLSHQNFGMLIQNHQKQRCTTKNRGLPHSYGVWWMIWGWIKKVWLNSAKLIISLNQVWQRIFVRKPDTQEWNRLPKLVTLRTFPQLDAPGASKHPANKAARKPVPGGVDVWASKNHPGGAFRKSAEAINGSMDWLNRKSAGNLGFWKPIQSLNILNVPNFSHHFSYLCESQLRNILSLFIPFHGHGHGWPGRHFNTPPISNAWEKRTKHEAWWLMG